MSRVNTLKAKIYKNVNHKGRVTSIDILVDVSDRADEIALNELQTTLEATIKPYEDKGAIESSGWFGDGWNSLTGIVSIAEGTSPQQITGICTRLCNDCQFVSSHYVPVERYTEE